MMLTTVGRLAFLLACRSASSARWPRPSAAPLHETFQLALPRVVRSSRLYEATAKNLLRVTIELVGGVVPPPRSPTRSSPTPGRLAVRKGAGNVVELGSIAAFGFSPLWILAAAADVDAAARASTSTRSSRELVAERVLPEDSRPDSVDELLAALEGVSGTSARLIDIPPLELDALRQSLADLRRDATSLPTPAELARVFDGLREAARRERREPARGLGRHRPRVLQLRAQGRPPARARPVHGGPAPVRDEGFGAYADRVSRRTREAVARHFDPEQATLTERGLDRLRRSGTSG